jgi:hypothetical protein
MQTPMKYIIASQWVKVPPDQSLANRAVVNLAGKPGNGGPVRFVHSKPAIIGRGMSGEGVKVTPCNWLADVG